MLSNICIHNVAGNLKKVSDAFKCELPKSLAVRVASYMLANCDPRKYHSYIPFLDESFDNLAEAGLEFLRNTCFSSSVACFNYCVFRILNWDTVVNYEIFEHEYYEFESHRYYFLNESSPQKIFPYMYCKLCIKDIATLFNCTDNVMCSYYIRTLHIDNVVEEVIDLDNYCSNCFGKLLYTLNPTTGEHYIDVGNQWGINLF
jgi:hypothetical protein